VHCGAPAQISSDVLAEVANAVTRDAA